MHSIHPQQYDRFAADHHRALRAAIAAERQRGGQRRAAAPADRGHRAATAMPSAVRRGGIASIVAAAVALIAGCGGDDAPAGAGAPSPAAGASDTSPVTTDATNPTDAAAAIDPATGAGTTEAPATTRGGPSVAGYCDAQLAAEEAVASEDPIAVQAAFSALQEAALPDNAALVDTVVAEAESFLDAGTPPTPAFETAYGELVGWVDGNCGFGRLEIVASEYAFGGLATEVDAGPVVIALTNTGAEGHELALMRKDDGVTQSFDELLAMPEEQAMANVTMVGSAFALPDATGHAIVDLVPGEYLAICFLPVGATPDVIDHMATGGTPPAGPPHFIEGMRQEFTVAAAAPVRRDVPTPPSRQVGANVPRPV